MNEHALAALLATFLTALSAVGGFSHAALNSVALPFQSQASVAPAVIHPSVPSQAAAVAVATAQPEIERVAADAPDATTTAAERPTTARPIAVSVVTATPTGADSGRRLDSLIGIVGNVVGLLHTVEGQSATAILPQQVAAGGESNGIAAGQSIGMLSNVTIVNPTISAGSLPSSSVVGTIGNAIDSALGEIDDLTSNSITAVNATTTNLVATGTAQLATTTVSGNLTVSGTISGGLLAVSGLPIGQKQATRAA